MAGRIAAPKHAIVEEEEAKAAAPIPAKITASAAPTTHCLVRPFNSFFSHNDTHAKRSAFWALQCCC